MVFGVISFKTIGQKQIRKKYTLTQKGKDLIPILIEHIVWFFKYNSETEAGEDFVNEAINNRENLIKGILNALE